MLFWVIRSQVDSSRHRCERHRDALTTQGEEGKHNSRQNGLHSVRFPRGSVKYKLLVRALLPCQCLYADWNRNTSPDSLIHGAISRAVELEEKLRKNFANPLLQSVNLSLRPSCKSLPLNCFSILVKSVSLLSTSVSKMNLTLADRRTFNLSHNISLHYEWWQPSVDVRHVRCKKKKIQEI